MSNGILSISSVTFRMLARPRHCLAVLPEAIPDRRTAERTIDRTSLAGPLCGSELEVVCTARRGDGAVTVVDPTGHEAPGPEEASHRFQERPTYRFASSEKLLHL